MPAVRRTKRGARPQAEPSAPSEMWLKLEALTDRSAFQEICDRALSDYFGYEVHPYGLSAHGTVRGTPDSWAFDRDRKLCALEYSSRKEWRGKLKQDLEKVAAVSGPDFVPAVFVFCTNRHIDATVERRLNREVREDYGWELRLYGQGALAVALDTECQDIRQRHLGIRITRHNWRSLLAICKRQRQDVLQRYAGKYDPTLYIERRIEDTIQAWLQAASDRLVGRSEDEAPRQLLVVVDEAGAGKSNVVLHLAERVGSTAPVLVLPGGGSFMDEHTIERELLAAVGYEVDASLGPEARRPLRSPLMLRVFSEVYSGCTLGHVPKVVASDLWRKYWNLKIVDVSEGLRHRLRGAAIGRAIKGVATLMLERDRTALRIDDLAGIAHLDPDDTSPASLLVRLKDAAMLFEDPVGTVRFVHEPFLEFVFGQSLADELERPAERENGLARIRRPGRAAG